MQQLKPTSALAKPHCDIDKRAQSLELAVDLFHLKKNTEVGLSRRPVCPPCEAKQRDFDLFGYHAVGRVR